VANAAESEAERPLPPPLAPAARRDRERDDDREDDRDDEPRRSSRADRRRSARKKSGGIPTSYIIGGSIAAVVLLGLFSCGLSIAWTIFNVRQQPPPVARQIDFNAMVPKQNVEAPPPKPRPAIPKERPPLPPAAPDPKLAGVRTIDVQASALAYDRTRGQLLAAVPGAAPKFGNTVAAFDPATGQLAWSTVVGSDPSVLALSDDGKALWVGLLGMSAVRKVDLDAREAGPPVQLDDGTFAETMVVIPGMTDTIAVSLFVKGLSPRHKGVVVLDSGDPRPERGPGHTGSNRIVATDEPAVLYGYNNETTDFGLRRMAVDDDGVRVTRTRGGVFSGFGLDIVHGGGRIYATSGAVADVRTGKLAGTVPAAGPVAVDPERKRAYYYAADRKAIEAYSTDTLTRQASYTPPAEKGPIRNLTVLGGTGLAYRSDRGVVIVPVSELK
jgi:DNA-binding beta-propeller fold protein YncE